MGGLSPSLHLNLDQAWEGEVLGLPTLDALEWGPRLRFTAPSRLIENFYREFEARLPAFLLYGSGDFHHLTALWLRKCTERIVLVSFDNHPDWDVRPPRWCCGSWVNRALELPHVRKISVWGCGNFECWWPTQLFGNRRAERAGKLDVHAWADGQSAGRQRRRGVIFRGSWREQFERFADELRGSSIYITVDLDCLEAGAAVTNWENGKFEVSDVCWAIARLREAGRVIAGDICGAYSGPKYARRSQRFVSEMDHPKRPAPDQREARASNLAAIETLWPALTGGNQHDASADQECSESQAQR